MIRLLLADLRHNLRQWAWTTVVAVVAATVAAAQLMVGRGSLTAARAAGIPEMEDASTSITGWVLTTVVLAVVAVLTTVASLAVASRARDHGLWRAQGMGPARLRAILLGQLGLLGAGAALVGVPLGMPAARMLIPLLRDENVILPGAQPQVDPADLWILLVMCVGATVLGGWGATRRSTRTQVVTLLHERDDDGRSIIRRVLGALVRGSIAAGLLTVFVASTVSGYRAASDSESAIGSLTTASFSALGFLVTIVPWVVPVVERAWTGLVPVRSVAWYMARRSAAYEAGRSSASVLPFALATGLVGMFFGFRAMGASGVTARGMMVMFGLALMVAWTGGVAVIAMGAGRRRRDGALLIAAGGTHRAGSAAQALEGVIHAVTAVLLGLLSTVASLVVGAVCLKMGVGRILLDGPWMEIGVVGVATLVTTCTAVVLSGAAAGAPVAGVLRARD